MKFSTNLYSVFLMLWYRYRQVPGRQNRLPLADSGGAYVSKEPRMPKMDSRAADMALAVWNGYSSYVRDARRHARQCRPVEQVLNDSNDVGLVARARSRSFCRRMR